MSIMTFAEARCNFRLLQLKHASKQFNKMAISHCYNIYVGSSSQDTPDDDDDDDDDHDNIKISYNYIKTEPLEITQVDEQQRGIVCWICYLCFPGVKG